MREEVRQGASSVFLMNSLKDQRLCMESYFIVMFTTSVDVKYMVTPQRGEGEEMPWSPVYNSLELRTVLK